MWCDNCLLLLPLRGGAIAWATIIFLYSTAGALFLQMRGDYFFFTYPERQIYGGIAFGVASIALVSIGALSNRSYIWTRACKFLWPFVIVISAIRAIIMLVELQRGKDHIAWECANGGQMWTATPTPVATPGTIPAGFCTAGFSSLFYGFVFGLIFDLIFQIYMFFLIWRFSVRLEHYSQMKGPLYGGYYN